MQRSRHLVAKFQRHMTRQQWQNFWRK